MNTKFLGTDVSFPTYFAPATAWLEHGPFATWIVRRHKPRRIVELGTHYGFSYFSMCETVAQDELDTECYAVDTWVGDEHAGLYGAEVYEAVVAENEKYEAFSRLIRKTFLEALNDIEDGSVDLLHIDGRHFYADVVADFESWIVKLAPSAVVMFHDTEVRERGFGVYKYWAELSKNHPSFNFQHGHGLGVLAWGGRPAQAVQDLTALAHEENSHSLAHEFFEQSGLLMHMRKEVEQARQKASELQSEVHRWQAELSDRERVLTDTARTLADTERELMHARQRPLKFLGHVALTALLKRFPQAGLILPKAVQARSARSKPTHDPDEF